MNILKKLSQLPKKLIFVVIRIPGSLLYVIKNLPRFAKEAVMFFVNYGGFFILLNTYLAAKVANRLTRMKYYPKFLNYTLGPVFSLVYRKIIGVNILHPDSINRLNLIDLALRNMRFKKSRTVITVGGMSLGIGAIVFLVSMGYGLQKLVIGRIARLDEMRQVDVTRQTGGKIQINDKTISDFKQIQNIDMALPMIAVVGRVNYQNSVSDMAVFGVTSDYLKQSAIKPTFGKIFDSNELSNSMPVEMEEQTDSSLQDELVPAVAGVETESETGVWGEKIQDVEFNIDPDTWMRVRIGPSTVSPVIGFTQRVEGTPRGGQYWGGIYDSIETEEKAAFDASGNLLGKWIRSDFPIWDKTDCDATLPDCIAGKFKLKTGEDGKQLYEDGYVAQNGISIQGQNLSNPMVLGDSTESMLTVDAMGEAVLGEQSVASGSSDLDWVEIASESAAATTVQVKKVELPPKAIKQAVVNKAMLKILNIRDEDAVGKTFSASFVVVGDLLEDSKEKVESIPADYSIVGVIPDDKAPIFYVPFVDMRGLGIVNYSQVKVVIKNQNGLDKVRKSIEALGYSTRSVADTVNQINNLFNTAKTVLALLGMVALAVASLGMFNTLTISLLERTREVGLMKAMGMKSYEVQELFLTESMIMGFFGGLLGIFLGFLGGKLVGAILSVFSVAKGIGFIDISYIPASFIFAVVFLSLTVGLITGIYPARRATKISALNALRYE